MPVPIYLNPTLMQPLGTSLLYLKAFDEALAVLVVFE